jgi:DNA modification methylase
MMHLLPATTLSGENRVHHASALRLLRSLASGSVHLIATDPPYGIGYASSRTTHSDGTPRAYSPSFGKDELDTSWLGEAGRVLADKGALYLCTRWDVIEAWRQAIEAAGLHVVQRIVWDKCHWGMGDLRYYGSQTEDILFAVKGNHVMRWNKREGNVWRLPNGKPMASRDGYFDNPTQKPVKLMQRMIERSSDVGDVVLDPFCGSGTTPYAARQLGRRYIAGDISLKQVEIARRRLAEPWTPPLFAEDAS